MTADQGIDTAPVAQRLPVAPTGRMGPLRRLGLAVRDGVRSARARILAWVVLLTAFGMTGAGIAAYLVENERLDARIDRSLYQEIKEFEEFQRSSRGQQFARVDLLLDEAIRNDVPDEHQSLVGYLPGRTVTRPGEQVALHRDQGFRAAVTASDRPVYGNYQSPRGRVRYATKPVVQGELTGTFVAIYFTADERAEFAGVVKTYAVVALVALAGVALTAWLTVGRLLRPIRDVRRTARQISETDLSRRIIVTGNDDVSALARTFNAMLDRLEEAFATQRQFLDDAGHELRTPITIVRGHLELLDDADPAEVEETRALVLDELDRMSRLVEDLVLLAKAQRPGFLRTGVVHLGMLTDNVLDKARALGDRHWQIDARADVEIDADEQRLTQALVQLAQNAVKFTGSGDVVAIGSTLSSARVRLWVRDTGPGVAAADAGRIFERFQRGSGAPRGDGSGLGLAIVRAIAEAHGGRAYVISEPGHGARFVVDLPGTTVTHHDETVLETRA